MKFSKLKLINLKLTVR